MGVFAHCIQNIAVFTDFGLIRCEHDEHSFKRLH